MKRIWVVGTIMLLAIVMGCGQGKSASIKEYIADLRSDKPELRREAAKNLGKMGLAAREAVPALVDTVGDKDATVRAAANEAVSRIGTAEMVEVLLRSGDHEQRAGAALALGMDYEQACEGLITRGPSAEAAVPALIGALADSDAEVRGRAAEALGKFKGKARSAVPGLCARLKDTDSWVRNRACFSLGYIGDERAVPALIDTLRKQGETERVAAICGLGLIGPEAGSASPYLRELSNNADKEIREAANEALSSIQKGLQGEGRVKTRSIR